MLTTVFRWTFRAGRLRLLGCIVLLLAGPSAGLGCGWATSRHGGDFFAPEALREVARVDELGSVRLGDAERGVEIGRETPLDIRLDDGGRLREEAQYVSIDGEMLVLGGEVAVPFDSVAGFLIEGVQVLPTRARLPARGGVPARQWLPQALVIGCAALSVGLLLLLMAAASS